MKLPIPDDWNEQEDGYACVFACIPNSPMWRATYRGMFYQLTWWHVWDKDTGSINGAKAIANQVYEELCMANCQDIVTQLTRIADAMEQGTVNAAQTDAIRQLTAVVGSQAVDLENPIPSQLDYTGEGIANPLNVLHSRFFMDDVGISPFNKYSQKNITETLETLFRVDSFFDVEAFSNVASILDSSLKMGDETIINVITGWLRKIFYNANIPSAFWQQLEAELADRLSVADLLWMIAVALGEDETKGAIVNAIKSINQTINLNNYNGCCDEADCNCDEAETQTFNLLDLCEQDDQVININGNGQV